LRPIDRALTLLFSQRLRYWLVRFWIVALMSASVGVGASTNVSVLRRLPITVRTAHGASAGTPLGINVDDLAQSASAVFTDAMKQASPWSSDRALALDAAGNVTQLARGQVAQSVIYPFANYPSGDYTLLYDGRGSIDVDPRSGSVTEAGNGRAVVRVTAQPGIGIRLRLSATDPRDYVRNIRLILPGYAAVYQSVPFTSAFLTRVAAFNVIRFVHWSHGDTSAIPLTWPMRPSVDGFSQAGASGVAWDYQIALANATGDDPWFVIPAGATNLYVTQLAALVHARLDARLHPIFEYAEGSWRPGTAPNQYAAMAGRKFRLATDPQAAALAWYATRSAQVFALVQQAFGADAGRVVRVLGGEVALSRSPAETIDRTLLATAAALQGADAFAVDASDASPATIAYTRSLLSGTRLQLIASGGAVTFTSAQNVAASTRTQLAVWRSAGGGLFAASSVTGSLSSTGWLTRLSVALETQLDALRTDALSAFAQQYPTTHVAPQPLAVQSVLVPMALPSASPPGTRRSTARASIAATATDALAINAGGPATGSFAADEDYSTRNTWTYTTSTSVSTNGVTNAAPAAVYQSQRTGSFTYTLPGLTASKTYSVVLHFAELYFKAAGARVFNVSINGTPALTKFDVYKTAGNAFKAVVATFSATASAAGQIAIVFTAVTDNPIVNGIEVQTLGSGPSPTPTPTTGPTPTPTPTPTTTPTTAPTAAPTGSDVLAIDAGGAAVGTFAADTDFSANGSWTYTTSTAVSTSGVTNAAPAAVYQTQRTGSFTYTLPNLTAGKTYGVLLHFAELYFKATGARVFTVSINGAPVLTNFDVYKTAGGAFKAMVKTFSATADGLGKIAIVFTPVTNNPIVNGIEVQTLGSGPTPTPTPTTGPLTPDQRADAIVNQLTVAEALSLVEGQYGFPTTTVPQPAGALGSAGYVPGVPRLGVPALQESDAGLGVTDHLNKLTGLPIRGTAGYSTALPSGMATAATWNPQLAYNGGAMLGTEAHDEGFNVELGGGINLAREPRNGRNFEYAGEDPLLAGIIVGNEILGTQAAHVISTIKHDALNDQQTGQDVLSSDIASSAARNSDLLAFQIAIQTGSPGAVMCAYNKINSVYACSNSYLLGTVLKGDWAYPGWVMSDWGAAHAATDALAGLDQESAGNTFGQHFGSSLAAAVASGQVPLTQLHDMDHRILRSMFAVGVVDNPPVIQPIPAAADASVAQADEEQAAVLLKNRAANGAAVLPLSKSTGSIAVIGANAEDGVIEGSGSSQVTPVGGPAVTQDNLFHSATWDPSPPLTFIKAEAPNARVTFASGLTVSTAVQAAQSSDVAIVFAYQFMIEGVDATDLSLPSGQDALIEAVAAANPNTIVVLETGGPVKMPWAGSVSGIFEAWFPGQRGGQAIARLLFGDVDPSGRLPITFPQSESQLPRPVIDGTANPTVPFDVNYNIEGADVGYKWFNLKNLTPLFPFGFGLSYTTFSQANLAIRTSGGVPVISFDDTNTGSREGMDVAQCYMQLPDGQGNSVNRLVGWQKVDLLAGQAQHVTITADPRATATFDASTSSLRIVAGTYPVFLSSSAAAAGVELAGSVTLGGLVVGP
jgi:beta-glucosidase